MSLLCFYVGSYSNFTSCLGLYFYSRESIVAQLRAIGAKTSGTMEEIVTRLETFKKTPGLFENMEHEAKKLKRNKVFGRELHVEELPGKSSVWTAGPYPSFTQDQINQYAKPKLPGTKSMLQKGRSFYNSRKLVTIKVWHEKNDVVWVRGFIERSYGTEQRPVIVKFEKSRAVGGYCPCRIGRSGLCSHVIAILYNLKHHSEAGEFLLPLACTSKKQKWHKKGSNKQKKVAPISYYNVTNTVRETKVSNKKRNIAGTVEEISNELDSTQVELHFLRTIGVSNSNRMKTGGLYTLLAHKYISKTEKEDHDYEKQSANPETEPGRVDDHHYTTRKDISAPQPSTIDQAQHDDEVRYFDVEQSSPEWDNIRKNKITASKTGDLIGLGGSAKFSLGWKVLAGEQVETKKNFKNFQRGIIFEAEARDKFNRESGTT